jgi:toxin ParE1/3/4
MPARYRTLITAEALADLETMFGYIDARSPQGARSMVKRLLDAIDALNQMPSRHKIVGRSRKSGAPVHSMVVRPYIVYYRIDPANLAVYIMTVRHGARRQPRRFP